MTIPPPLKCTTDLFRIKVLCRHGPINRVIKNVRNKSKFFVLFVDGISFAFVCLKLFDSRCHALYLIGTSFSYSGTPPLLVISLDGFAREYLDRKLVPSLDLLSKCGDRADYVFPSYPSKTFPNHYTIATGLYPEAHGIVDNAAYDPKISPNLEDMKKTKFPKFYGGEPIWSQAVRHGKKMFCLFWPGCSFNITGHNPTLDLPYNRSLQYSQRVDMVIDWLNAPASERPSQIMAYFDQPDYIGEIPVILLIIQCLFRPFSYHG